MPFLPGTGDVAGDESSALRAEIVELRRRIESLEAERDDYAQQNAELFVLQQVFSTMNSSLEIDDILSTVLRGVTVALKFGRVVLFDVRDGTAARRLETAADGEVIPSPLPHDFTATATFAAMIAGTSDFALGTEHDPENPLPDGRSTYCMLPLISRDTVRGILYADEPPVPRVTETQLRVLLDFAAQAAIAIENARLHSETKRLLEETQRLASTDPLTGLFNRRALGELLDRELSNAERYEAPVAFLILDLDDLKRINDTRGHAAGDEALRRFADVLRGAARKGDILARYAGDEFVLVMSQTDRNAAEHALRRLFETFRTSGVACSAGAAMFPYDGTDAAALFCAADEALYRAKQLGKGTYAFHAARRAGKENPRV